MSSRAGGPLPSSLCSTGVATLTAKKSNTFMNMPGRTAARTSHARRPVLVSAAGTTATGAASARRSVHHVGQLHAGGGGGGLPDDWVVLGAEEPPVLTRLQDLLRAPDGPEVTGHGGWLLALGEPAGGREQDGPHPGDGPVGGAEMLLRAVVDRAHRLGHHQVLAHEVVDAAEDAPLLPDLLGQMVVVFRRVKTRGDPVAGIGDRGRERGE